jgi:hypothetical protein
MFLLNQKSAMPQPWLRVGCSAYVSSEPGPGGEPLYEWIDVREVMSAAPSQH